tara:strand:+ start:1093 stop:1224 length:132 start_codon:yes stop_codon:yes gene_type:complete
MKTMGEEERKDLIFVESGRGRKRTSQFYSIFSQVQKERKLRGH